MWKMIRTSVVVAAMVAAGLGLASPVVAAPCDDGMASIEYALDLIVPGAPTDFVPGAPMDFKPGAACSTDAECKDTNEKCEGGSCCVKKGQPCTGLGYCCGHPLAGCVNGSCPNF